MDGRWSTCLSAGCFLSEAGKGGGSGMQISKKYTSRPGTVGEVQKV